MEIGGDEPPIVKAEHYDSGRCEAQAKPRTTGANPKAFKHGAFTLAEVLITLSIIGVVAALTIPSLIAKNQEKETVVRVKKAYSTFCNIFNLAVAQYADPENWGWGEISGDPEAEIDIKEKLFPYFNIIKICTTEKDCNSNISFFNKDTPIPPPTPDTKPINHPTAILADGSIIKINTYGSNCNVNRGNTPALQHICGTIGVDINGTKRPNQWGKDNFLFYITKNGILPVGAKDDRIDPISRCRIYGWSCAAWILEKENMDYLKHDIFWD